MQHNKKRNTALVYEFLVRYITKCLIENKNAHANQAMTLIKRFYGSGPLREEMELFNCVTKNHAQNPQHAEKLLAAVVEKARAIDLKRLEHAKTGLINEINKRLDASQVYKTKVPYYSVYASLQTLFNHSNGKRLKLDSVDRVNLEQRVVSFLTQERTVAKTMSEALKLDPQYNNTVYRLVIRKFDEKYKDTLNESQKKLLTKYAVSLLSENKKVFANALQRELDHVKNVLGFVHNKEIRSDKDLMRRIAECRQRAHKMDASKPDDATLVQVLKLMALAQEVAA